MPVAIRTPAFIALLTSLLAVLSACSTPTASTDTATTATAKTMEDRTVITVEPDPVWISDALQHHSLVALGDVHGSQQVVPYLLAALQDPEVWNQVDDIAVEMGNAQHQALADRYLLGGDDIPLQEVRAIWRDTLYFMAWQYQVYEDFVVGLRQLNQQRSHKIRLVLAEPAFDWNTLTHDEWVAWGKDREPAYAERIQQQIVDKHRKGILLFGTFHMFKQPIQLMGKPAGQPFESLVSLLGDRIGRNNLFVVLPQLDDSDNLVGKIQSPALLPLKDSPLGQQSFTDYSRRIDASNHHVLNDVADGYLYLGPEHRDAPLAPAATNDPEWHQQMRERAAIAGGRVGQQVGKWIEKAGTATHETVQ
ncbi:hypothetical protein [Oceanobacter kriegii]|uniref:hypothetical protein n=1 Tax=Oceanobacter kriegii TaxID=64972 RepID=UPI00042A53F3|nr:hypothetical protein [Oceanobacter kriegii]